MFELKRALIFAFMMTREDTENNRRILDAADRSSGHNDNMEYAWLEPRHDPIATDTNLAEIDFEDFKNEDLAFAFSCGVSSFTIKGWFTLR